MAYSYDDQLLTDKDWVRFLTGDTVEATSRFSDAVINAVLGDVANKYCAAAQLLEGWRSTLLAIQAGRTSKSVDGLSVTFSKTATDDLKNQIDSLREQCAKHSLEQPRPLRVLGSDLRRVRRVVD